MRTNIEIDDDLMAAAMAAGGTLLWDDSDEAWAKARAEAEPLGAEVNEPAAHDEVKLRKPVRKSSATSASKSRTRSQGA